MKQFSLQRKLIAIAALLVIAVVLGFVSSRQTAQKNSVINPDASLFVTTSIYPVYDLVRTIGGGYVDTQLLLSPGNRPDTAEFEPSDVRDESSLIFLIGHGLDSDLVSTETEDRIVMLDQGIDLLLEEGSTASPYYWLSVRNAAIMVDTIARSLIAADPGHQAEYQANAAQLLSELEQVDRAIATLFDQADSSAVAIYGFDWGYFARDYNLDIVAQIPPVRVVDAQSPVTELTAAVNEYGLNAIYSDIYLDPTPILPVVLVQSKPFSLLYLDTLGGVEERTSYTLLMAANARTFFDGLQVGAQLP